jgi:hypothetical protein
VPWFTPRQFTVVRPRSDGRFDLVLPEEHRRTISALLGELDQLIETDPSDPDLRRLSPPAYLDDPERDAAYQLLAGDELRTARRAAIDTVRASMDRSVLDEDQVWAWLRALNGLRVVVGTKLDITDEDHDPVLAPDDPQAPLWAIYDYTGLLEHAIIAALG